VFPARSFDRERERVLSTNPNFTKCDVHKCPRLASQPLIRYLLIKTHIMQQLKLSYLSLLHGLTHLIVYHASLHPLSAHLVPTS